MRVNKEEIINRISETYSKLTFECQQKLANKSKVLVLPKGETLVRQGQYSDKTFFIFNGCARAYYLKDGKDISDWFAFENDFISSINSFFLNIPSPHFIELLENTVLLEISRKDIEKLSDDFHDFERLSKIVVTKTMLQQHERISSMQFHKAEQKYANILSIRPDITQRVPLTHIASYIGITLETLSRIRNLKNRT
ncbi:Crp/Fnr family transcriptional regulator [Algibacter pectinivorans]|uniref:cAMP-binding domain of CRP or a regulatory subunit of cAMP-dependent protein kinases n=1 Tax=Algibacter pectinivorans TaxID=870482 RepID=A0A1I1QXD5_9FLAO|nr:Crp/Fnr family transcriptional regulator [Algibacter pectinivorans]SFD23933.1 cAMP-binding domain of CRP or a regulatory subunit of cAMP-dependent protein kinases [Algibacter pectinivorans]